METKKKKEEEQRSGFTKYVVFDNLGHFFSSYETPQHQHQFNSSGECTLCGSHRDPWTPG